MQFRCLVSFYISINPNRSRHHQRINNHRCNKFSPLRRRAPRSTIVASIFPGVYSGSLCAQRVSAFVPLEVSRSSSGCHEAATIPRRKSFIMRFQLVDRILELTPGKSITAIKNLSLAEEYLADHFPGFPVLPGVLMVEALTQAGAWLLKVTDDFAYSTVMLKQAKAIKFNNFVSPGKTLSLTVEIVSRDGDLCTVKGQGTVDGGGAVSAKLILQRFNLAQNNPEMVTSDQLAIEQSRQLLKQIWPRR